MIYKNISELVGNTPLFKVDSEPGLADIYLKLEFFNPSSSVKDRAALFMIKEALDKGEIKKGDTIVEPTSGNTGIGLAMLGSSLGLNVVIVMPDSMSEERKALMRAFGAELILTGEGGMEAATKKAEEIAQERGGRVMGQFYNPANIKAHLTTTGPEILRELDHVDGFVAGVGTGGTLSGVGQVLKEKNPQTLVWGLEPDESPLISEGQASSHKIQGIGANFIPENYKSEFVDKIIRIKSDEAIQGSRSLAKNYGILAGISSGANYQGAKILAKNLGEGKVVVTVLPDTGERYLSTGLYDERI